MGSPAHLNFDSQEPTFISEMETMQAGKVQKLAEYVRTLQEERGKVEAFKRELPLCMQLIDEAIEAAKQRVMDDQSSPSTASVLDAELSDSERSSKDTGNFMSLKRRWQHDNIRDQGESQEAEQQHKDSSPRGTKRRVDFDGSEQARTTPFTSSRLHGLSSNHRQGGAFVPFVRERKMSSPLMCSQATESVPDSAADDLVRVSSAVRSTGQNGQTSGDFEVGVKAQVRGYHASDARMSTDRSRQTRTSLCQPQRKPRRCWSTELHERFVSALQQLGGPQVATPKQIREVMKVDNLTNDEVKSHLQKYRLHTSRPSPPPHAPQLVVLGWMRPDQFKAAVGAASQASKGDLTYDGPQLVKAQKCTPPQSTVQPRMKPLAVQHKRLPAISQSPFSRGSPTTPNSSSLDSSNLDEGDDVQERKPMSSGHAERVVKEQSELQLAMESKGSTPLVHINIDSTTQNRDCNSSQVKLLHAKAAT